MPKNKEFKEENFLKFLKLVAPGTPLGRGLEIILQAGTGGLIVVGDTEKVLSTIEGGFKVNCHLTPTSLAELAKMDGAIILSEDIKRILYANTELVPDYLIPTGERGTRHRAAERMAKQTSCPVIAISQSRRTISLYQGNMKYVLKTLPELMSKANQALLTLEGYRATFHEVLTQLELLEFQDEVRLLDAVKAIQRGQIIKKIKEEIERYMVELGEEARLIEMQLKEIIGNALHENRQIIRDYAKKDYEQAFLELEEISMHELLNLTNITNALGYGTSSENLDLSVFPRGYRILSKVPHLPSAVIENVVKALGDLQSIMNSTVLQLTEINEVGERRANSIKRELERLRDGVLLVKR
jgi:diadenylate cyclase